MVLMTKIYGTTPMAQEIHKFTNLICTNPQIHQNMHKYAKNMHKYTQSRGDSPMVHIAKTYGTTPTTQETPKKITNPISTNTQIHPNMHKYSQNMDFSFNLN